MRVVEVLAQLTKCDTLRDDVRDRVDILRVEESRRLDLDVAGQELGGSRAGDMVRLAERNHSIMELLRHSSKLKSKDLRPGSRAILSQRMATIRRGTSVGLTNPKPHRNDRSHDHADDLSMNQDPSKQGTTAKPERCRPCQDPFPCAENYDAAHTGCASRD